MPRKKNKDTNYGYETVKRKKFAILKIIDLYILKEFLFIYFCTLFAFNMLFLISNMINKVGDLIDAKATFFQGAYYFILKQPQAMVFVLPITLLLACMYSMAKMGMNNEITAMRASGISLFRCGFSIYVIGFLVSCVHYVFIEGLAPQCEREALIYRKTLAVGQGYLREKSRMLMYRSPNNQRTWLVEDFVSNNEQRGVQIKRYDEKGVLIAELGAKTAHYKPGKGWYFYGVSFIKYKRLVLDENYSVANEGRKKIIVAPVTEHLKEVAPGSKIYKELGSLTEVPKDILNSIKAPDEMSSREILDILGKSKDLSPLTVGIFKTLLYSRYSQPWICLFAVFLGVPLAGSSERRGVMLSVITAIGIMVIYMLVSQITVVLGNRGYLPPFIAGAGPTILFLMYILYKVIRQK